MDDRTLDKLEPLTGILGTVLGFIGSGMYFSGLPKVDDPASDFVAYAVDNRSAILTGTMLLMLAGGLLLWWLGLLRATLSSGDARCARLGTTAMIGGAVGLSTIFVSVALFATVTWRGPDGLSPELVRIVVDGLNVGFGVSGAMPFAVMLLAASVAMTRHEAFPSWLSWLGLAAAVLNGLGAFFLMSRTGTFSPYSALAFPGAVLFFAWIACTSVIMSRRATA